MEKIKVFLKKNLLNNIGYKILALALAALAWMVITNAQDPTINKTINNIPVTIENEDLITNGEYVYTISSGETASITITGARSVVSKMTAADFKATADFSELSITNAVPINVELSGEKARKYANQITIAVKTHSMIIKLEDVITQAFEVVVNYTGVGEPNLVVDNAVVNPVNVSVTAPQSVIRNMGRVVATVNYADIDGNVALRATPILYDLDGRIIEVGGDVSVDFDEVVVNITANYTKALSLIAISTGAPASGYKLAGVTMSFNSVIVKGPKEVIEGLTSIRLPSSLLSVTGATEDVVVTVNLNDYAPAGTVIYDSNANVVLTAHIIEEETTTTTAETDEEGEPVTTGESDESSDAESTTGEPDAATPEEETAETTEESGN